MSFYVIEKGKEGEIRSGLAKLAEIDTPDGKAGAMLNITIDDVRIHLDSVDTEGLRQLLERRQYERNK